MKELIISGLEKTNPIDVLKYNTLHKDVSKSHCEAHKKMSSAESMKKIVSDVVERVEKETKKMVERK
ncbi:MAG: hypothetical protein WCX79_00100 [Candidatus Paceibacterota bacterium]|jgi:hypothetical protein